MNILKVQNNHYQPLFKAKKQTIKDADKIMRTSKKAFPFVSSTFMRSFYLTVNQNSKYHNKVINKANKIATMINTNRGIVNCARINAKNPKEAKTFIPYVTSINSSLSSKVGNCQEQAQAALGVLFANGYYNSKYASLVLDVAIMNKRTNKVVYRKDVSLDHGFVLTDMNQEKDLNIVVDPWLGFADSKENAIARYKSIIPNEKIKRAMEDVKEDFFVLNEFLLYENDYVVIRKLKLLPRECNKDETIKLGEYIKENFSEVVID